MADFDATPLITGVGSGVGAGLIGFLSGRRQSKAQTALLEVQAARAAVDAVRESMVHLQSEVESHREELRVLREEVRGLRNAHADLVTVCVFVQDAWRYYESRGLPYFPPSHEVTAVVNRVVAQLLTTGPVTIAKETNHDRSGG